MKRIVAALTLSLLLPLAATAGEVKMIGIVEHIDMSDQKGVKIVVKDKSGKPHKVVVTQKGDMSKFTTHRITEGDSVRIKYDDTTNTVTYIRKTAGC